MSALELVAQRLLAPLLSRVGAPTPAAAAAQLILSMQAAGALFFAFGIAGALVPEVLTALRPATLYGRNMLEPARAGGGAGASAVAPRSLLARASEAAQRFGQLRKGAAFTLFYVLANAQNALALLLALAARLPPWGALLLALFQLHAARRLLECLLVHRFSRGARMPLLLVAAGAAHYVFASFALLPADAAAAAAARAPPLYRWRGAEADELREEEELAGADAAALDVLIAALGLALFVAGNATQFAAHRQFAGLRRARAGGVEGDTDGAKLAAGGEGGEGARDEGAATPSAESGLDAEADTAEADTAEAESAPTAAGVRRRRAGGSPVAEATDADLSAPRPARAAAQSAPAPAPAPAAYPFPRGGLFELSLSPHYAAEVLIYCGLLLVRTGAAAAAALARDPHVEDAPAPLLARASTPLLLAWVVINLSVTAVRGKRWYRTVYPDSPEVAAIFPYLL